MTQVYGSSVSYDEFLPEVMQYVPDVPDFVATNAVRNACIEFCERSRYLQMDLDPIAILANQSSYAVQTPVGTKFVLPEVAYYNKTLLIPKSSDELANIYRQTDWRQAQGAPAYITRLIAPVVMLVPTPVFDSAYTLNMRVSVAPTRDSTEIDSEVYEQFLEVISYGARSRLYRTPKQPYFDKNAGDQYMQMFRHGINEARMRVTKGLTRDSIKAEYQRFV
jgi:hypothetical protein